MSTITALLQECGAINVAFEDFLKSRDIPDDVIKKIGEEKINPAIVLMMPEDDLKLYFPKYGDRTAIIQFCRRNANNNNKQSLIERLRLKINNKPYQKTDSKFEKKKHTRVIEIGWLFFNSKESKFRQVRTKYGGGTRKVNIDKTSKCEEILNIGKSLFFPDGISTKGNLYLFTCELYDFKNHPVDLDLTVQDMYNITSLSTLRFYLATRQNDSEKNVEDNVEEYIPATDSQSSVSTSVITNENLVDTQNNPRTITEYIESFDDDYSNILNLNEPNNWTTETDSIIENWTIHQEDVVQNVETVNILKLILHRGNVFKDMLDAFQNEYFVSGEFQVEMILPNGEIERAEDLGGVLRDALSEFFETFYDTCTLGTNMKVPYVRHDYGEKQWAAVARIIERAWKKEKYFPIKIAPVFFKNILGITFTNEELIENFLQFICDSDSRALKLALDNFDLVEEDSIIELFSSYDSKWIPSKINVRQLTIDIAHKELIQKPAFIAKCFSILKNELHNFSADIYKSLWPSEKNILNNLVVADDGLTPEMLTTLAFLKRFVKESCSKTREAFIRYCTGSNIVSHKINISFNKMQGLLRAPIAHTCNCSLELSTTYESFVAFRNEFNNLLSSNIWVMDAI